MRRPLDTSVTSLKITFAGLHDHGSDHDAPQAVVKVHIDVTIPLYEIGYSSVHPFRQAKLRRSPNLHRTFDFEHELPSAATTS